MALIPPNDPRFALTLLLVRAAQGNDHALVKGLLDQGAPADGVTYERFNAMMAAAEHGNVAMGQALLAAGAVGFDPSMVRAESALHRAVTFERSGFALWLLEQPDPSFEPNRRNADGWTVLHLLGVQGDVAVAGRLLQMGADPELTTPEVHHRAHPDDGDEPPTIDPARTTASIAQANGQHALLALLESRTLTGHLAQQTPEGEPLPSHVRARL